MPKPPTTQEELPADFFQDGTLKTSPGPSNILIVTPNMGTSAEQNVLLGRLAVSLTEKLRASGVMNCCRYRKPREGDPSPAELEIPDSGPKSKPYKAVTARRKKLWESGGIPVDLDSYSAASLAAHDYVESIWLAACEIGWKDEPLVLFLQGNDQATADADDFDLALGCGLFENDDDEPSADYLTARADLVDELLRGLHLSRPELRINEGVQGYALESFDHVAWWLRRSWNDHFDPASEDEWRCPEVNCILLTFGSSLLGIDDLPVEGTASWLAEVVRNLTMFQPIASEERTVAEEEPLESPVEVLEAEVLSAAQTPASTRRNKEGKPVKKSTSDDRLVREALDFIGEKANETVYKGSIEIGDYVLDKFFDGDIERARSKNPAKKASYRTLCRHTELVVHPTTLAIMVRVAGQEKFFQSQNLPSDRLSYSHKAELVKLPDDENKVLLFKEAVAEPLSLRALRQRVRQMRTGSASNEPSALLGSRKQGFDPEALLRNPLFQDEEELRRTNPETREQLLNDVTLAIDRLSHYIARFVLIREVLERATEEEAEPS